jgi:hypothetical protein
MYILPTYILHAPSTPPICPLRVPYIPSMNPQHTLCILLVYPLYAPNITPI